LALANGGRGLTGIAPNAEAKNNLAFSNVGTDISGGNCAACSHNWAGQSQGDPLLVNSGLVINTNWSSNFNLEQKLEFLREQFALALAPVPAASPLINAGVLVGGHHCLVGGPGNGACRRWDESGPDIGVYELIGNQTLPGINPNLTELSPEPPGGGNQGGNNQGGNQGGNQNNQGGNSGGGGTQTPPPPAGGPALPRLVGPYYFGQVAEIVRDLQQILAYHFKLSPELTAALMTGVYDEPTRVAVCRVQAELSIQQTCLAGPLTRAALNARYAPVAQTIITPEQRAYLITQIKALINLLWQQVYLLLSQGAR
jgi:hypothetical protein